jgi:hypothetical protein
MGYSCNMPSKIERESNYRIMEVVMMKRAKGGERSSSTHLILVDNQLETLNFVQESMDEIINNIIRIKNMGRINKKVDESAKLFEKNLDPLFSVMTERTQGNILDKLSISLKKALILMASAMTNLTAK